MRKGLLFMGKKGNPSRGSRPSQGTKRLGWFSWDKPAISQQPQTCQWTGCRDRHRETICCLKGCQDSPKPAPHALGRGSWSSGGGGRGWGERSRQPPLWTGGHLAASAQDCPGLLTALHTWFIKHEAGNLPSAPGTHFGDKKVVCSL